jgi:hypothetical protein
MTEHSVAAEPIDSAPAGYAPPAEQFSVLQGELSAAGVEMGDYDRRVAQWVAGWDWSTVATVTSWIKRASARFSRFSGRGV